MRLTKNIVSLKKGFVTTSDDGMDNRIEVSTVQSHLMQWGYMLTEDAFKALSKSDLSKIKNFNDEILPYLKEINGGKYNHKPLYKNFPQEVMSLSDFELFLNAIMHYWSNGTWEPSTVEFEKPIKFENIKYNMIDNGNEERFLKIFTDLVSINTSLTPDDLEIVKWFVDSEQKLIFPEVIPFKENLCTLAAMGIENLPVKTTTDVLRIAVHLSGGDISLPKVPPEKVRLNRWSNNESLNPKRHDFKFKKFTRKERRYLLNLLENSNCDVSEMVLKRERWIRLGEILHPFEYKNRFPKSFNAFNKLRNKKVRSWYSYLENSFKQSLVNGLEVLSKRPGEFARRIDWLVRTYPEDIQIIMDYFNKSVKNTSNKVLFEVYNHFENRLEENPNRTIFVKGARKPVELPTLDPLPKYLVETIHQRIFETLKDKFSTLEKLGNCWIDDELKKIPLPTNMRSMSSTDKPIIRGQRIPFGNSKTKVIRPFIHWIGPTDLDLSVTFVDDKNNVETLSYSTTGLKVGKSCHSGDVRHRQGPCAEYIDIDIKDALNHNFKYAVIDVRNYDGNGLNTVETVFGMMEREHPTSNKTWLPETISNTQKLESKSTNTIIGVIDLVTKEYIMLDIDSSGFVTARSDTNNIHKAIDKYSKPPKVSVYDLILLHVEGRGRQVTLDQNVDTFFKYDDFAHSYEETAKLMGV